MLQIQSTDENVNPRMINFDKIAWNAKPSKMTMHQLLLQGQQCASNTYR